jgi:hypothetical protein
MDRVLDGGGLPEHLPGPLVMAAAEVDRSLWPDIGPYLSMDAGPESLAPAQERARAVYASGWRPAPDPGPSRRELVELVRAAAA